MNPSTSRLIAGTWRRGRGAEPLVVTDPATGEVMAELDTASLADVDDAVAGANAAEAPMEALAFFERAELLHRCADIIDDRHAELALQLSRESGKPLVAEADGEVHIPAEAVGSGTRRGRPGHLEAVGADATHGGSARRGSGRGRVLPAGSVSVVQGFGDVGRALVGHHHVHGIGFVGSKATAEAIVRVAGMKRTLIEASGNGPQIVCDDAAIDAAAAAAVFGAHYMAGQCCVATQRLLVQVSVHDELVERIVHHGGRVRLGDPLDDRTTMEPLNNEAVAAKMDAHVADAVARGAKVLLGGRRAGGFPTDLYHELTVIDGVTPDMAVFREESFGPVVPITVFDDDDEAIALSNESDLGLQAAVFTSSLTRAYRYIERLRTGTVIVNDTVSCWETHPPFGGAARTGSGWGRIGGRFTMLDMTDLRTAVIDVHNTRDGR